MFPRNPQRSAEEARRFRLTIGWIGGALVVGATTATLFAYWDLLTSPYTGTGSEIIVRPVAAVIRIGVVFAVYCGMVFVLAMLIAGKLPRKVGRNEVEFDDGPTDEAKAAESLDRRVRKLEDAQQALTEAFEEHEKSHSDA